MTTTDSDPTWPRWLAILKISKVPFWFIWITPVVFGYLAAAQLSSPRHLLWFVIAVLGTCLLESANCAHNELVDQEEDAINQPHRTSLVRSVGEPFLWRFVIVGYSLCLVGLVVLAVVVGPLVAALMLIGGLAAPLYNWGPRFKRTPGMAEVAIGWAVFFGYLWGWAWNHSIWEVSPVIWVLTFFFAITSLMKDLPDVSGDEQVAAPGIFSIPMKSLVDGILLFIFVSPYLLVGGLVLTGVLEQRFWAMMPLLLLAFATLAAVKRAAGLHTFIAAYEITFLYVHIFFLTLFLIDTPTPAAFALAAALFVGRALSLHFQLAPRFVENDFSWTRSLAILLGRRPEPSTSS